MVSLFAVVSIDAVVMVVYVEDVGFKYAIVVELSSSWEEEKARVSVSVVRRLNGTSKVSMSVRDGDV